MDKSVLFIHGLGGHWHDTWKAKDAEVPWPRDILPDRLPHCRILSWGYDSHITSWQRVVSHNTVTDHANNLLRDLSNYRDEDESVRIQIPTCLNCNSIDSASEQSALVLRGP